MINWTDQRVRALPAAPGWGQMAIILPERAAEICLGHLHDDKGSRYESVGTAIARLGLAKPA